MTRLLVLLSVLAACGCGGSSKPGRVAVQGSIISADGFVPNGTIRFLPQAGTKGPVAITVVKNGLYHFNADDGPFPGPHQVLVNVELGHDELSKLSSSGGNIPPLKWEDQTVVPSASKAVLHFEWGTTKTEATRSQPVRPSLKLSAVAQHN